MLSIGCRARILSPYDANLNGQMVIVTGLSQQHAWFKLPGVGTGKVRREQLQLVSLSDGKKVSGAASSSGHRPFAAV